MPRYDEESRDSGPDSERTRFGRAVADDLDSMSQYLKEIGSKRRLSREEEVELSRVAQLGEAARKQLDTARSSEKNELLALVAEGDRAQETLIEHNLRLVVTVAKGFQRSGIPLDELIAEGNKGLIRAARKYDGTRGVPFGNYAPYWIKQHLLKYTTEQAHPVKIPSYKSPVYHQVRRAATELMQLLGRDPTAEEISERTNLPLNEVDEVFRLTQTPVELDSAVSGAQESSSSEFSAYFGETVDVAVEREERMISRVDYEREVSNALSLLTPREAEVLALYYGLEGRERLGLDKIGALLGVTRERARQIKAGAIKRLKEEGLPDPRDV